MFLTCRKRNIERERESRERERSEREIVREGQRETERERVCSIYIKSNLVYTIL